MILITGGAGYIGSNCAVEFLKNGHDIIILDNLSTSHIEIVQRLNALDLDGKIAGFEKVDIKNEMALFEVFKKYDFSSVIHFAGSAIIQDSFKYPEKYHNNNVLGTKNIICAMEKYGVKNLIFSSSCATYGLKEHLICENDVQKPINPYGQSKLDSEREIKKSNLNYVIFRYFNAIGANTDLITGEWHNCETRLLPNILRADDKNPFKICGNDYNTKDGTAIRDYIDVNDLATAHYLGFKYLETHNQSNIFNLGNSKGYSVKEVYETACKVKGEKIPYTIAQRREGDPDFLVADTSHACNVLNFAPKFSLEKSIKCVIEWEKEIKKIRSKNEKN